MKFLLNPDGSVCICFHAKLVEPTNPIYIKHLQNAARGGMAIFILGNLSDPDCVVEGRIRLGRRSHYNLDYYAPEHASVLSEWKGPLRVSRITWLGSKVGPRLREFSRQMREKW